jgi:predicted nucleic acid-binding protein
MPVVDTSALIAALFGDPSPQSLVERLSGGDLHAPHLVDVEFTHVARRLVATGLVSPERAQRGRSDFADLPIIRYPHGPFLDRMWQLRDNLTAYDAVFVALSEALDAPLVTTDGRLASAPGHHATVEVY